MSPVARRMRAICKAKGISCESLASKLTTKRRRWTRMRVWRLQNGGTRIIADDVPAIAKALGTTILDLYGLASS